MAMNEAQISLVKMHSVSRILDVCCAAHLLVGVIIFAYVYTEKIIQSFL
jgi:hypothetical protein